MTFVIGALFEFGIAWLCIWLGLLRPWNKYASPAILLVALLGVYLGILLLFEIR